MAKSKKVAVKKVPVAQLAAAAKSAAASAAPAALPPGATAPKRRGRPPGSTNKAKGTKGKVGRPAATEFLYVLRPVNALDEMGLPVEGKAPEPVAVEVRGPFPSEAEAQEAAIAEIGTDSNLEVTLFRDYKRGRPEVKVRLV